MKKLSKKAWKEYFEDRSNWITYIYNPYFGFQITRLKETDLWALEEWFVPDERMRGLGVKPCWRVRELFTRHEINENRGYPESTTKTNAIEELWSKQEGKV